MIYLGYNKEEKIEIINKYIETNDINRVYIFYFFEKDKISDIKCDNIEYITFDELIEYRYFYSVLQNTDSNTLIVIDECMRRQNRNDLNYNCIRHFLKQTNHKLIFQWLPIISQIDDFMILYDFDTQSKYKLHKAKDIEINKDSIICKKKNIELKKNDVKVSKATEIKYAKKKEELFSKNNINDPDVIPRNLLLISGNDKIKRIKPNCYYIGRNNRFKLNNVITYKSAIEQLPYKIIEFPHNYIDFINYLYLSRNITVEAFVADTKTDIWYFDRYNKWTGELSNAYNTILQ